MIAIALLALSVGAVNLGCKVSVLVRGDRERELIGGAAGLIAVLILGLIMLQLGLVPRRVFTSSMNCPWLQGC